MDDIIEFIIELVLEGLVELMKSPKVPFFIRFIIYLMCSSFLIGISGLLVWCAMNEKSKIFALVCLVLAIVVFLLFVGMTKEVFKKKTYFIEENVE